MIKKIKGKRRPSRSERTELKRGKRLEAFRSGDADIFLNRGRYGNFLKRLTGQSEAGVAAEHFTRIGGITGAVASYILGVIVGKPHVRTKRREVIETLEASQDLSSQDFKRLILATGKFLYDNSRNAKTVLYDPVAENLIYNIFGVLAKKSDSFRKEYGPAGRGSNIGKNYFRYLIQVQILRNFGFIKKHYSKDTLEALRYSLIGSEIDELGESQNYARLQFLSNIFEPKAEVATIDRLVNNAQARGKVMEALINIHYEAAKAIKNPAEARRFLQSVCTYYKIPSKNVFDYAKEIFYRERPSSGKAGLLSDDALRRLQTIRRAGELYGFEPKPKRAREKPVDIGGFAAIQKDRVRRKTISRETERGQAVGRAEIKARRKAKRQEEKRMKAEAAKRRERKKQAKSN
jgi:hypothetical protein